MLEPTVIRQTATLIEWHDTHGIAQHSDGTHYILNLSQWNEFSGNAPLKVGNHLEIYLHQNEYGKTEKIEFCRVPQIGNAQYISYISANKPKELFDSNGQRFFRDVKKDFRLRLFSLFIIIACIIFVYLYQSNKVWLAVGILSAQFFAQLIWIWRYKKYPQHIDLWRLTIGKIGIAFNIQATQTQQGFYTWQKIQSYKIKEGRFSYLHLQFTNQTTVKISLNAFSKSDQIQIKTLIQQYFQAACKPKETP